MNFPPPLLHQIHTPMRRSKVRPFRSNIISFCCEKFYFLLHLHWIIFFLGTIQSGNGDGKNGIVLVVHGFSLLSTAKTTTTTTTTKERTRRTKAAPAAAARIFDYEYIPSNNGNNDNNPSSSSLLASGYPPGTPAGLCGEAVRAALRSHRCIAWKADDEDDDQDVFFPMPLTLQGPGCLNFLNNELSQTFGEPTAATLFNEEYPNGGQVGTFRSAALLTSKGKLLDILRVALFKSSGASSSSSSSTTTALLLPSPGHSATGLFQRLEKYIFPLDQVTLSKSQFQFQFTLASVDLQNVERVVQQEIFSRITPQKTTTTTTPKLSLPNPKQCLVLPIISKTQLPEEEEEEEEVEEDMLVVLPTIGLPDCAAVGCTLIFRGKSARQLGQSIWNHLVSDDNVEGPVEIKALEWENLRIQVGLARFGCEITAHLEHAKKNTASTTAASPLELFCNHLISFDKGCYMGQEGIASVLKNPRGPPRTLYQVVFEDDFNLYDFQTAGDVQDKATFLENKTRPPVPDDILCVLGSNEEIVIGSLTSVAQPGSTGDRQTVALCLVKRADSILRQMKERGLSIEINREHDDELWTTTKQQGRGGESILLPPPPQDPLHGLEIIVQGTYTVGTLQSIPQRRLPPGSNLFVVESAFDYNNDEDYIDDDDDDYIMRGRTTSSFGSLSSKPPDGLLKERESWWQQNRAHEQEQDPWSSTVPAPVAPTTAPKAFRDETTASLVGTKFASDDDYDDNDEKLQKMARELAKAKAEAQAAAAEAEYKVQKMELLQQRVDEQALAAAARRNKNPQEQKSTNAKTNAEDAPASNKVEQDQTKDNDDDAGAKAKRKEAKLALLKQRADDVLAKRREKQREEHQQRLGRNQNQS